MKKVKFLLLLTIPVLLSSCYHAKVTTDQYPSNQVVDKPFASGWIYGLVPPDEVNAAEECEAGIAMVETRLSFVNMLVANLTFGIYTPMHIRVTCADSQRVSAEQKEDFSVPEGLNPEELTEVFKEASDKAALTKEPVLVKFRR